MSTRERRSLWGSISTSKKVNALSAQGVILYTFTMPHLDDEGFIDGDPKALKYTAVPLRDDIPVEEIEKLINEIATVHKKVQSTPIPLWIIHKTSQGNFIQDPVFHERQFFKGIRKKPSKIKDVVDRETNGFQQETKGCLREGEEEVKRSEVKEEGKGKEKGDERVSSPPLSLKEWANRLIDLFNSVAQYLPKVTSLSESRLGKLRVRKKEKPDFEWWKVVFEKANWVLIPGKEGRKDWYPTFDWLIKNDINAVKVFEGNYEDAKRPPPLFSPQPGIAEFYRKEKESESK
jgi:hypothetical protein